MMGSCGSASFGCKRWVVFELRTRWVPNVGINNRSYLFPNTRTNVRIRKYGNEIGKIVNGNNCFSGVPSMCTYGIYL
jgi:hypothetical protein